MRALDLHRLLAPYLTAAIPLLAGLLHGRATFARYLLAPFAAILAMLFALLLASMLLSWARSVELPLPADALRWMPFALLVLIGYFTGRALAHRTPEVTHKRGTRIEEGRAAQRAPRRLFRRTDASLTLAGAALPPNDETKHFKLIGTTGTGKSTAIRELLSGALARGDRAIIADPDAGYLDRFHDAARGDLILNPFDERSARWDPFAEIDTPWDVEHLARALLPDTGTGSEREWKHYARVFLTAVTRQLHAVGPRDVAELYQLLVVSSSEELRRLVARTPAAPFLEEANARMFGSIRSVASSAVGALAYIAAQPAASPPLSIRHWVRRGRGALFLPYRADQIASLRSIISAWMRLAIFDLMNRPEHHAPAAATKSASPAINAQRSPPSPLWVVVDELDALGAIDGLKDALARLRKFGGRCVLGFQSIAQVSDTYGTGEAQTIVENCGTTLILRCSSSEHGGTARFASQLIGQREVIRRQVSRSRHPDKLRATESVSHQHVTEPAVLPAEIEQLPDLAGFLKLASSPAWLRVRLRPQ